MCVFRRSTIEFRSSVKDYIHHNLPQDLVPTPPTTNKRPQRETVPLKGGVLGVRGTITVRFLKNPHFKTAISLLGVSQPS